MESAEAEKTAILAEIEEIAGLGKDKHVRSFFHGDSSQNRRCDDVCAHQLRFGTYHETSYGSKVVAYSRLFGIDYLYRPSLKVFTAFACPNDVDGVICVAGMTGGRGGCTESLL